MKSETKDDDNVAIFEKTKMAIKNKHYKKAMGLIQMNPSVALYYDSKSHLEPNLLAIAISTHQSEYIEALLEAKSILPFIVIEQTLVSFYYDKHFLEPNQQTTYHAREEIICNLFMSLLDTQDLQRVKNDIIMASDALEVIAKAAPFIIMSIDSICEKRMLDKSVNSVHLSKNKIKV